MLCTRNPTRRQPLSCISKYWCRSTIYDQFSLDLVSILRIRITSIYDTMERLVTKFQVSSGCMLLAVSGIRRATCWGCGVPESSYGGIVEVWILGGCSSIDQNRNNSETRCISISFWWRISQFHIYLPCLLMDLYGLKCDVIVVDVIFISLSNERFHGSAVRSVQTRQWRSA